MIHTSPVLVIIASMRPRRVGPSIASWIASVGRPLVSAALEIVDLKDWPLPLDGEAAIPATGKYESDHTLAWSRKISGASGFVFVTPQHNWGYPASLKNALDQLFREWADKPAMLVTYGGHGGGKCAEQLRPVLGALGMKLVEPLPSLTLTRQQVEANDGEIDPATQFADRETLVRDAFAALAAALKTASRAPA